jgi:hypothetical protein
MYLSFDFTNQLIDFWTSLYNQLPQLEISILLINQCKYSEN